MKKIFIKICKLLGYEILDQNKFSSPTLRKELNEELSVLNEKSIANAPNINLGNFYFFINSLSYAIYFVLVKPLTKKI